jgi:DNA (cytosine-5)-methyltransferase 1
MLTHGELFAGISGFGLGFEKAGFKTVWHVEIDEGCQSVLSRHYPDVPIFGDIRGCGKHNLERVNVITFGSPCQDLSVAGKREGFDGERSGLFFEAVRIIHELKPDYAVWENVPGAFSSNGGADFQSAISELLCTSVPMPRSGRWANAGMVRSGQTEISWRVLDAQYFGLAQRRKRMFLIAGFGGRRTAEILFERESSPGSIAQGEKEREKELPEMLLKALTQIAEN